MADKRTGNFTAGDEYAGQADPFSDLTRITGFEPRHNPGAGDFGINLEQELMRDLDGAGAQHAPVAASHQSDHYAADDLASLGHDLEGALRATEPQALDDLPVLRLSRFEEPRHADEYVEPAALAEPDESELEDEFNALLGNAPARAEAAASDEYADQAEYEASAEEEAFEEAHPVRYEPVIEQEEFVAAAEDRPAYASAPEPFPAAKPASAADDPFAMLAAMAEKYKVSTPADTSWRPDFVAARPVEPTPEPEIQVRQPAPTLAASAPVAPVRAPAPEIETVDVTERATMVADDLDLPAFETPEPQQSHAAFDDIDAEFNNLLNQMSSHEPLAAERPSYAPPAAPVYTPAAPRPAPSYAQPQSYAPAAPAAATPAPRDDDIRIDLSDAELSGAFDEMDEVLSSAAAAARGGKADEFDDGFDDDVPVASYAEPLPEQRPRRGLLIAAIVGGVAILGVAGALAISMMGSAQGGAPSLVKSDHTPIKVRPANAGGTSVPNQTSSVYETVAAGGQPNSTNQDKLLTTTEDPIELTDELPVNGDEDFAETDEPKAEDRIEQVAEDAEAAAETLAVAPRKVRTMVVKPDGSLVPAEAPAKPEAALKPAKQVRPAKPTAQAEDPAAAAIQQAATEEAPASVETGETTASIEPEPAATGPWNMQIASEGSEGSAEAAYKKLLAKHGKLLGGKGVSIVKADIAGKGTRWRVRVPAETRNEAASLCSKLKSAGGSCFVSKS